MFSLKRHDPKPSALDEAIENLLSEMAGHDAHTEEYSKMAGNLKTLMEAKAIEPKPDKLSVNTLAVILANLTGIAMILSYEKVNVLTSKALSQIMKPKT